MSSRSSRPWWVDRAAVCVLGLGAGLLFARCGADHVDAPPDPPPIVNDGICKPVEETMPVFFGLLHDPTQPLAGIGQVVGSLETAQTGPLPGNSLGYLLQSAGRGLVSFGRDPNESSIGRCGAVAPDAPLCLVGGQTAPCENRLCSLRRALDFGVKDQAANKALLDLQPLLAKVLGYMSNTGTAADGQEHYEIIDLFNKTSRNEGLCSPANLLDVMDGLVVYFRQSVTCGTGCGGRQALAALRDLLAVPVFQSFLQDYRNQDSQTGRPGFQALGKLLGNAFANMPEGSTYFDQIQNDAGTGIVDALYKFFETKPATYGLLEQKVKVVVQIAKKFLDPMRAGAISKQLKAVTNCVTVVDTNSELVGALYDLLSRPSSTGKGLDLLELVDSIDAVAKLDAHGVLMSAIHAVIASTRGNPVATDDLRNFLVNLLTMENARQVIPPIALMINDGVLAESLTLADNLLYGCQANP